MLYVFDFDGTIVDVWERYWRSFVYASQIEVELPVYRDYKLLLCRDSLIANALGSSLPEEYFYKKTLLLESDELLALDTLLISPMRLARFVESHSSVVLTKRRNELAFRRQLTQLGLDSIGWVVRVLPPNGPSKAELLATDYCFEEIVMIGDSPEDMEVGKLERAMSAFVQTGIFAYENACKEASNVVSYKSLDEALKAFEKNWQE